MSPDRTKKPAQAGELQTYRRLLRWVRPYLGRLLAGFAAGLIYSAANGGFVWVIRGGVREVFHPGRFDTGWFVLLFTLGFPLVALVRGASDYLATYYIRWVGNRVVMDLRNAMFAHLHTLPVAYFSQSRTGELISRTTSDTMLIERSVSIVLSDLAKQPLTLLFMVGWVFSLDVKLALVSMVIFPICIVPIAAFGRRVRRNSREAQQHMADVVSILQESVSGVRIVKAFGMEHYEMGRFGECTGAFFRRIMRVAKASASLEPIIVVLAAIGMTLLLWYVRVTGMPVDEFCAFTTAYVMMYEPVKKLSKVHVQIQQSSGAADRIFEVLDTQSTVADRAGAVTLAEPIAEIAFDHATFSYEGEPVLRDICLRVTAGERVAFVGSSGAGKTTLVNLVPRFYDVTGGRILLNGRDLREYTLASIRKQVGLVTQETFLFNDTVANNIAYGTSNPAREDIIGAARRAHADTFITELPNGYDTVIGERGVRLSGGQRQRLSIARAILRNPPVLILDEATSALDTESERLVQAALDQLIAGRTVLAIAHRLSTIVTCNRIIVLDGGRIVQQGNHDALLAKGGLYKRLFDMQFDVPGQNTRKSRSGVP